MVDRIRSGESGRAAEMRRLPRHPQGLEPLSFQLANGAAEPAAEKVTIVEEGRPPGLKPSLMRDDLRGPEGPLFHGEAEIYVFFRSLFSRAGWDR